MSTKQPWTVPGVPFKTEGSFLTWVRGVLRRGWKVHPVKLEYLTKRRKRIKNTNPKSAKAHPEVWGWVCEQCGEEVKKVEVDHAGETQGKFTSMDDIQGYAEHLFLVDFDSLECVCVPCHSTRSLAQANGMSFEEAALEKDVIAICKKKAKEVVDYCLKHGYNPQDVSNPDKRRAVVRQILSAQTADNLSKEHTK